MASAAATASAAVVPSLPAGFDPSSAPAAADEVITPERRARWGPRWTAQDLTTSIAQYAREAGWVEGTIYPLTKPYTPEDNAVFHRALDVMAATLGRSTTLALEISPLSAAESSEIAKTLDAVHSGLGHMFDQFLVLRPLRTEQQAGNIGRGMEMHWLGFQKFEGAVKEKLTGEGAGEALKTFEKVNELFKATVVAFKGEKKEGE